MSQDRTKFCVVCSTPFEANTSRHMYCSRSCETRRQRERKGIKLESEGRHCRQCGYHFAPTSNHQMHCSPKCSNRSARESRSKFFARNPNSMIEYSKRYRNRVGGDGNLIRFFIRHPNAPRQCQACGDDRVLDIAHRPEYKRNGAWHTAKNSTWPEKVWILCPTCHALIDRKGYDPASLGLS